MGDFGWERILYCSSRICIFFAAQGTIFAFERQILDQRDNKKVDLNKYYEKKLVELSSRLDYLWNVNIILGGEKEVPDNTFLDKYLNGPSNLNRVFISTYFVEKGKNKEEIRAKVQSDINQLVYVQYLLLSSKKFRQKDTLNHDVFVLSIANELWNILETYYSVKSDKVPDFIFDEVKIHFQRLTLDLLICYIGALDFL